MLDTAQVRWCKTPPDLVPCQAPVSGHGAGFYGTYVVELHCVKLGESAVFVGGKVFSKYLHFLHFPHFLPPFQS